MNNKLPSKRIAEIMNFDKDGVSKENWINATITFLDEQFKEKGCRCKKCKDYPYKFSLVNGICITCGKIVGKSTITTPDKQDSWEESFVDLFCEKSTTDFTRLKSIRVQEPLEFIRQTLQSAIAKERESIVKMLEEEKDKYKTCEFSQCSCHKPIKVLDEVISKIKNGNI